MVAREVTKRFQQFLRFDDVANIGRLPDLRGEFTVVVGPRTQVESPHDESADELIYKDFCHMTVDSGTGRRAAVSAVARKYGRSAKYVYAVVERLKKLGD
jgi:16S rRNA C1402 (ribose-2'-O) methylase RsmI